MSQLNQDIRFAIRNLRKQPSLALAAILTLALGIGVNTGIFSIVDSVLLTPPPFREPERLAIVWGSNPELAKMLAVEDKLPASNALLYDWQKASRSFESLALMQANRLVLTGQGEPQQLGAVSVTGDFFRVLGTSPLLGRTIEAADDNLGKPTVAVLSYGLWQRTFSGDPKVIGRSVTLSNNPFTVIGVLPPRFTFPRGGTEMPAGFGFSPEPDIWVPMALTPEARQDRGGRGSVVIGRLRPGVDLAAADTEMKTITQRFGETYPQTDAGWSARLQALPEQLLGNLRPALLVLWAAVGLVLLIACANVASLLLARAASRQKEIALRMAMGAGRRRVISQLLTESALLSLLGGLLGIALAWYGLRAFEAFVPAGLVGAATFSLSLRALAFTAALCLLATVLAGLVPAFQMTRPDLAGSLREGTRAGAGTLGSRRTRSGLVVAEVALAVLLLVGAGLLLRSFVRLLNVDPGFRTERVLAFELGMPPDRVPPAERIPFLDRVLEQVRAVPGVESAALISDLPMGGNEGFINFTIDGRPEPTPEEALTQVAALRTVSPGYFELMQIPLRHGRLLADADRKETLPVGVIDEALAGTFFPNEDPIGKRLRLAGMTKWITVVGVVGSVRHWGLQNDTRPEIYLLGQQYPGQVNFMMRVVVKTAGDPASLGPQVRRAVYEVDPEQPVSRMLTLEQLVSNSVAKPRFSLLLLGLFASLALLLSIIGIYGITSYSVSQRTREVGLRMALGAEPKGIVQMIVGETGLLAALGIVIGLAAAYALNRVIASLLFGVASTDAVTFVSVALGLALVALVAAYLPGRRATRVSPVVALRTE